MGKNKKPMKLRSSSWTHASLYVIIFSGLVAITAFVGFELSFIQQAASSGNTSRWNIVIVVGLVGGLIFSSIFLLIARIIAVKYELRTIPKPYIPIKNIDVPKEVAKYLTTEYTRTAMVAHLSQPTAIKQEGWGHPDSPLAGMHFRSTMRNSFWVLLSELDARLPGGRSFRDPSLPPDSPRHILTHPCLPRSEEARKWIRYYFELLDEVKYARSEPDQSDWVRMWGVVFKIFEFIQQEDTQHNRQVDPRVTLSSSIGPPRARVLSERPDDHHQSQSQSQPQPQLQLQSQAQAQSQSQAQVDYRRLYDATRIKPVHLSRPISISSQPTGYLWDS